MELAVSTYSLLQWRRAENKTVEHCLDWLAEQGVKLVEFSGLGEPDPANPIRRAAALRRRCEKVGLRPIGYCVSAELLVEPDEQEKVIARVQRDVDVAAELGVPSMRHDVTRGPQAESGPMTFAAVLKAVVPAVRRIADHGAEKGVKTTLENHGFYMQASTRVQKLLDTVDHPNFALTIDLGNFLCVNEDPVEATRRLAGYAVHAHTKDFHVRSKKTMPPSGWFATPTDIALRGAIVGHGVIDIPAQLKLLKKAGYKGNLSLEFEGMEEPRLAVKAGLEYLRGLL